MTNNKQSMKLYTEEEIIRAFGYQMSRNQVYEIVSAMRPIKLPSDEEVEQYLKSFPYTKHLDDGQYNDGVIVGAELAIEWMRNKIQGGNK